MNHSDLNAIFPNTIRAIISTTRDGNMATHTQLNKDEALANRQAWLKKHNINTEVTWLEQVHGINAICLPTTQATPKADACFTREKNTACVVMTADCLPLLISNQQGDEIAAIHAGWRGLKDGVIQNTLKQLQSPMSELIVYLGPAISQLHLELNDDIRQQFINTNSDYAAGFVEKDQHIYGDLYAIARVILKSLGVVHIYGGQACTYKDSEHYFSYRRQGDTSGRMASLIFRL